MAEPQPVLIAGAGIAGLSLALALAGKGLASIVLERRCSLSEAGAGIQLGPNAMQVLRRLGVAGRLEAVTGCPQSIAVHDGSSGRPIGRLPLGTQMERRFGAPYRVVHRADLQAALAASVDGSPLIRLATGFEVATWLDAGDRIEVRASHGGSEGGRALIGADGIWSAVRRGLFAAHPLSYSGKMAARTVIPMTRATTRFLQPETGVWLGPDAHVVHYPIRAHREIAVVAIIDEEQPREGWGGAIEGAAVMRRLAGFAPDLLRFLEHGEDWRVWSLYDPPPLPSWSRGRVALMGDAAHPILPFLAQGGAMALEDAETMAAALARTADDIPQAFAVFEAARRGRVARVQSAARDNGQVYHFTGIRAAARNLALGLVPGGLMMRRYDWLYGWNGDGIL